MSQRSIVATSIFRSTAIMTVNFVRMYFLPESQTGTLLKVRMVNITALLLGMLFGICLIFTGMVNPCRVIWFQGVMGDFYVNLLRVMMGEITVESVGFAWIIKLRWVELVHGFTSK